MKAAVYHGKRDLRVEEIPLRELESNEVMIQVKYCGVCGTDMHIFNGEGGAFAVNPPLIPGHEFSGIVHKVGSEVRRIKVGQHVSADPNDMCGECYFCRNGKQQFCTNNTGIGTTAHGGFAEYVILREKQVYPCSDQLSFIEAAMAEPLSCCLHGIDLCDIRLGDTVLILGGGPIGMIMLQLARHAGASKIILSEPVEEKRALGLQLGADIAIDPYAADFEEKLTGACHNIDIVVECIGNVNAQADAVRYAGKGATVMLFGLAGPDAQLAVKPDDIFKKELKITSSFINPYTFERAVKVLEAGILRFDELITDIVDLDDIESVFTKPQYKKSGKVMIKIS